MTQLESAALIDHQYYKDKASWEQSRFISLCSVSPWSKKLMKPLDLLEFLWEKEQKAYDEEDLNRLKEKVKLFEK